MATKTLKGIKFPGLADTYFIDAYTKDEVNQRLGTVVASIPTTYVASINSKTGVVNLTAEDIGALPSTTEIPSIDGLATESFVTSKIAEAQLDGGDVDLSGYATKDDLNAALPDIKNDETNNLIIQDNAGNIITAIDATGITTTTVTVDSLIINGEIFSIISDEEIIAMFTEE